MQIVKVTVLKGKYIEKELELTDEEYAEMERLHQLSPKYLLPLEQKLERNSPETDDFTDYQVKDDGGDVILDFD